MANGPPLERFLGAGAADGSRALLGLATAHPDAGTIDRALSERLRQVDEHPQARSSEADEVRLALYVAAAQLSAEAPPAGVDQPARPARPMHPIDASADPRAQQHRRTLMAVIAHSGGWNATAKHRFGSVAHALGLSLAEAYALVAVAPAPQTDQQEAPAVEAGTPRVSRSPASRALLAATFSLFALSAILAAAILYVVLSRTAGPSASSREAQQGSQQTPNTPSVVPAPAVVPSAPTPVASDMPSVQRAFAEARSSVGTDPVAARGLFLGAYEAASTGWPEIQTDAFYPLAYLAADTLAEPGLAEVEVLERIARDAMSAEATPSIFAAALLSRYAGFVTGTTFEIVASDALSGVEPVAIQPLLSSYAAGRLIGLLFDGADVAVWAETGRAFRMHQPEAGNAALDAILLRVLRGQGALNERETAIVRAVVELRRWQEGSEGARSLVALWDDPAVPTVRLAPLSRLLIEGGVAPSAASSASLSSAGTAADRAASREAFAAALGVVASSGASGFAQRWVELFEQAQELARTGQAELVAEGDAQVAAAFAVLSASASQSWAGDAESAGQSLDEVEAILAEPFGLQSGGKIDLRRFTGRASEPDGVWAGEYLRAGRAEEARLDLLALLTSGDAPKGPADGDVLAQAAVVGSNRSVRSAAQRAVRAHADDPFVVNGLLEIAHSASPQPDVHDLIVFVTGRELPAVRSQAWRASVRRALAERLADLIARATPTSLRESERRVRDAYNARLATRTGAADASESQAQEAPTPGVDFRQIVLGAPQSSVDRPLLETAETLWDAWADEVRDIPEGGWAKRSLNELERAREARRGFGDGRLQRFAGAQLALVEIMAYAMVAERPSRGTEIELIVQSCAQDWRAASRVTEQLRIAERAMARLWRLRLAPEDDGGVGA